MILMRLLLSVLLCFLIFSSCSSTSLRENEQTQLIYRVQPVWDESPKRVLVELEFMGNSSGVTYLRMPHELPGSKGYGQTIKRLRTELEGVGISKMKAPGRFQIKHSGGEPLRIQYEIVQPDRYWESLREWRRPVFHSSALSFPGLAVLAFPEWAAKTDDLYVRFDFDRLPTDWTVHTPWGNFEEEIEVRASVKALQRSAVILGDVEVSIQETEGESRLEMIQAGAWPVSRPDLLEPWRRMIEEWDRVFTDDPLGKIFLPGSGTIFPCCGFRTLDGPATNYIVFSQDAIDQNLFRKSLFENWLSTRFESSFEKGMSPRLYSWFYEGSARFYRRLIELRSGITTLEDYVQDFNSTVEAYFISPAKKTPLKRVIKDRKRNGAVDELPALQGDLLIHRFHSELQKKRKHWDDVVQIAFEESRIGKKVSLGRMDRVYRKLSGAEPILNSFKKYIRKGDPFLIPANSLGPCAVKKWVKLPTFDLGFDLKKTEGSGSVTGVKRLSAAERAGLRNGMKLLESRVSMGKLDELVRLKVQVGRGKPFKIEYYPQGAPRKVPKFFLSQEKFQANPQKCLSYFLSK